MGLDASRGFEPRPTGTERYAREILTRLVVMDDFRCTMYLRGEPVNPLPAGVASRMIAPPRLWTHVGLGLELRRRPPDLLYIPAHVMPVVCPVPAVATVHDLGHRAFPEAHTFFQRHYLEWTTRRHVAKAAHIVVDSLCTYNDLVRLYGAEPTRLTVAPLGVDTTRLETDPVSIEAVRSRLNLASAERVVLHVGTLQPRKNLHRLVRAFAEVSNRLPDCRLVLAGGAGWRGERVRLQRTVAELGLQSRVQLLGYVPEEEMPALYGLADVLALPSLYEGFGLTALEAMAAGTPVVAASSSSLPEVVGEAGLLVDPEDEAAWVAALERALADQALAKRLAGLGRERALEFTWDRTAAIVAGALRKVGQGIP